MYGVLSPNTSRIAAVGDPIIVTPFFEKPSVAESLAIPAEIRTWDEHEEPLRLVADAFLTGRQHAAPAFEAPNSEDRP